MKEIRKIFNINRQKNKEKATFTTIEVVIISFSLAVITGVVSGYLVYSFNSSKMDSKEVADIISTFEHITDEYYEEVDYGELADAAIDGMLSYLDESYSKHLSDDATIDLTDKLDGSYKGIGIAIIKTDDGLFIDKVYADTPASEAGLKESDQILNINGTEITSEMKLDDVQNIIDEDDEAISMIVNRDGEQLSFEVKREEIDSPVVEYEIFERNSEKIGYIYLSTFSNTAYDQVSQALDALEDDGITSLVFDLRSNTGGYLNSTKDIASLFLKRGKVIYSLETKDKTSEVKDNTKEYRTYPIVVLVNGATASASEILTAALKESYGAIVVGTKTYGKGKVQQTSKLSDDTVIKYTTAMWYTPSGESIDEVGITPGVIVELDSKYYQDATYENDNQLQTALSVLSES